MRRTGRLLLALFAILLAFPLAQVRAVPPTVVDQQTGGEQAATTKAGSPGGEKPGQAGRPAAPSLQAGNPELPAQSPLPKPPVQLVAAAISGLGITAASLKVKFRRFAGLGVFSNWYSALFLITGAVLQTSVSTVASLVKPTSAPWIAYGVGFVSAILLGTSVRSLKPSGGESGPVDSAAETSANVILAMIEDGIRDRILTRMQAVAVEYAGLYSWQVIAFAGQRTVDEEIAIGRLKREDGEAAIKAIKELRSARDPGGDQNRKYLALLRLVSCCPLPRLRAALMAVPVPIPKEKK